MSYPEIEQVEELRFPTMAEQALEAFTSSKVTISLAGICLFNKAERSYETDECNRRVTVYSFCDDSHVRVVGRGMSYKAEAATP